MNCPNNCGEKLKNDSCMNSCKCCCKWFCNTNCLLAHIEAEHNDNINKTEHHKDVANSEFLKRGVMLNEITIDPHYDFTNFEFVKSGNKNRVLGSGAFGEVFLAKHIIDENLYAIKKLDKAKILSIGVKPELIYREINIHMKLVHPNIARLYSYHEDNDGFYLVLEYMDQGTLYGLIQKSRGLEEKKAFEYFMEVASGFYFLHENNLIHRDLKPENCLVDKNNNIKICDFGWTVDASQGTRATFCGTYEYMAPEIVKEMPYGEAIDVWSLGVLLYELIHSYSPFRVYISFILVQKNQCN